MLTALDIINRLLNYFNIQDKPKGKAFTVVAFLANFYILYVAINHLRFPGFRLKGVLYLLLFLVFLYFIGLNFLYYYTDKATKYDISPWVERKLGGNVKAQEAALAAYTQVQTPAAGVFKDDQVLPASVTVNTQQQANLDKLVTQLQEHGLMTMNYQGLDDELIAKVADQTQRPVPAMGAPLQLPYYVLTQRADGQFVLEGGLNQFETAELATITHIGLTPIADAAASYQVVAADAVLTGGEQRRLRRSGLVTEKQMFTINVRLAYKNPDEMR